MDGRSLHDKIQRGMGVAARRLGTKFIVYRPKAGTPPLASANRIIKLYASFIAQDDSYRRVDGYGEAIWFGVYDSSYTKPGDYLVGEAGIFFVSAQQPALPVQCILTNRLVSIARSAPPVLGGYAGLASTNSLSVLTGWPASLLLSGPHGGTGQAREVRFATWRLLLPTLSATLLVADVVTDDQGGTYVVGAAEQSVLGWRLTLRQIAA